MGDYDNRLGEWLKYLEQQAKPVGEESVETKQEDKAESVLQVNEEPKIDPDRVVMRDRLGRVMPDETDEIDSSSVIIDPAVVDRRRGYVDQNPAVFDDNDVPEVEDFLPFLKDKEPELPPARDRGIDHKPKYEPPTAPRPQMSEPETKPADRLSHLSEGTGEPKPVIKNSEPATMSAEPKAVEPAPKPAEIAPKPVKDTARQPRRTVQPPQMPSASEVREMWDRLPRHIQLLVGQTQQEVAQRSYKKFKEKREDLIARLLDPTLSLEETARILNVCPTTVRRYTNRGALQHLRTVGNQRRFRLSDILAFLETQPSTAERNE